MTCTGQFTITIGKNLKLTRIVSSGSLFRDVVAESTPQDPFQCRFLSRSSIFCILVRQIHCTFLIQISRLSSISRISTGILPEITYAVSFVTVLNTNRIPSGMVGNEHRLRPFLQNASSIISSHIFKTLLFSLAYT